MDLLGDIGAQDQLTAAREENVVLQAKVKDLSSRLHTMMIENESLKAEVEMYRQDHTSLSSSLDQKLSLGGPSSTAAAPSTTSNIDEASMHFVRSGNNIYPKHCHVTLPQLHSNSNLLCCALSPDDVVLATGGADSTLSLCHWGRAYCNSNDAEDEANNIDAEVNAVIQSACRTSCSSPVIATAFSPTLPRVVACAGMDGSVSVLQYANNVHRLSSSSAAAHTLISQGPKRVCQHSKYVRCLAWSSTQSILASASADGVIFLHKIDRCSSQQDNDDNDDEPLLQVTKFESLHLPGAVESMCFVQDTLVCYARNAPHLVCFDLNQEQQQRHIHLNSTLSDTHVSFAVLDLCCYNNQYLCAATDASRNIVLDLKSGSIIRNLYGHSNDGYSQPKVCWNHSGQYVMGNTQDESCVVVWDVASSQIVDRLSGHHTSPIRDLFASSISETLVTTSFDKKTNLWFS